MALIQLAQLYGLKPKKTCGTDGGEYHSSCPVCGGNDRFVMHPNKRGKSSKCMGTYFCRHCPVLISHDNDEAGLVMLKKWKDKYSHAVPYPSTISKDIGEAIQNGEDIRDFLFNYKQYLK